MGKAIVSVINDLSTDQRVHKICMHLQKKGYDVWLVGRKLKNSLPMNRPYNTKRFRLPFNKGPLFYACYNMRLYCYLLFKKSDLLWSNDLDTLPANFRISRLKKIPLIYDSHEYFTEVPELIDRPKVQQFWENIEKKILPELKYAFTVSKPIAEAYKKKYGLEMQVLYNYPLYESGEDVYNSGGRITLDQGSVNKDRGVEELISAMKYVENAELWIAGTGDEYDNCHLLAEKEQVADKVKFLGKIPFEKLKDITQKATIGVSLEKASGLNYTYALPNKLFDYVHSGIPVLVSDLPEMSRFVTDTNTGMILSSRDPETIAEVINKMLAETEKLKNWHRNALEAAKKYNWENETVKIDEVLNKIG